MTDAQLVKTWSVAAVVNAVGRVTTGDSSCHHERRLLCWSGILTVDPLYSLRVVSQGLAASLLFLSWASTPSTFLFGMCWNALVLGSESKRLFMVVLIFSGTFVVMPLATASLFGRANFQKNYGVVFMSFGLSALVAAWVSL